MIDIASMTTIWPRERPRRGDARVDEALVRVLEDAAVCRSVVVEAAGTGISFSSG
jgi:hypothetical protein